MVELRVHNPTGVLEIVQAHAPRLPGLDGAVIGELSNGVWDDERTFPRIRERLQARFPRARIVPFTEFPIGSEQIDSDVVVDMLVKKGAQAVITGNAA
jgi:hypothetical protein